MEIGILKDDLTALPFTCAGVHLVLIDFTVLSASELKSALEPLTFKFEMTEETKLTY